MTTILGIDPGSRITGYGVIRAEGSKHYYLASGCVRVQGDNHTERLRQIFLGLQEVVQTYNPHEAAIEQVFMHQNAGSALKLGQARGAAIVALANSPITIAEYSARQIKQSVVGYGAAKKEQVQHMVRLLLNLTGTPQVDAADALAVALCHANSRALAATLKMKTGKNLEKYVPSPLMGEGWGGGEKVTPHPDLPPQGGKGFSLRVRGKFRRGRMR